MLIQFTIQNFLSFRDEVTFSMVGVDSDTQHPDHLAQNVAGKGHSLLPLAAIYGANAAGKSNLVKAISFVQELVVEGTRSRQTIPLYPFKLGNYSKKPSKFEPIFIYKDTQYSYGFSLNREQILEEWLYGIPPNRKKEVMYFERITSESKDKKTTIEYGAILKGRSTKRQQFLDFVAEGTRPNQLFLTEAVDRNVQELIPIVDWFEEVLNIIPAEAPFISLENRVKKDEEFTEFLKNFLRVSGTGIDSLATEEIPLDSESNFPDIPKRIMDRVRQDLEEIDKNFMDKNLAAMLRSPTGGRFLVSKNDENQVIVTRLLTQHRSEDGELVNFSLEEESDGTQRIIELVPALFLLKQDSENVIFLDELDRRLHPLLSRRFIEIAIACRNPKSQLIFTTHDTNLLDLDLLRRDEIWFVEKDDQGVSKCYSLAEFKIRPDLQIEKGYLNARFGAIPFFGDIKSLGWCHQEVNLSSEIAEQ